MLLEERPHLGEGAPSRSQRLSLQRRPRSDGTAAELRRRSAPPVARCGRTSPTAIELARTVRALREPVERSRVVGLAPRSGRRAPPVACRCAGSPTSSVVAPPGRRLRSGPIGERRAVELHRRPRRRRLAGRRRSALEVREHGWVAAPARRGRAGPGAARQARAAAVGWAQDQLAGLGGTAVGPAQAQRHQARARRGRAGPGPAHHGPAGPSPARVRTSSDGQTRSGSSAGARSGSAGRTSRAPRPGRRSRLELGPTARRIIARQPRSEGQRSRRRSARWRGCGRRPSRRYEDGFRK